MVSEAELILWLVVSVGFPSPGLAGVPGSDVCAGPVLYSLPPSGQRASLAFLQGRRDWLCSVCAAGRCQPRGPGQSQTPGRTPLQRPVCPGQGVCPEGLLLPNMLLEAPWAGAGFAPSLPSPLSGEQNGTGAQKTG